MAGRRALAVALLLATLGSACDDEPEPDIADPSPTSSAPSPSESESSPSTSPTPEALTPEATVRAWVDAWNEALRTGRTDALKALGAPGCRNCLNYVKTINDVIAAGGEFTGGDWSVQEISTQELSADSAKVVVGMAVASGSTINAAGEEPVTFAAERRGVVYQLSHDDVWLIDAIDLLS